MSDVGEDDPGSEPSDEVPDDDATERSEAASNHEAAGRSVVAAVVTVAAERTIEEDAPGDAVVAALEAAGHEVATRDLVRDQYDSVQSEVATLVEREDVEAVVTCGGTGVSPDDVTLEAIRPLLDKELPGFGELFRRRSAERLGTRVVATRTLAGVANCVPIFCLPDGEAAARMGTEALVGPEVGALVSEASPPDAADDGTDGAPDDVTGGVSDDETGGESDDETGGESDDETDGTPDETDGEPGDETDGKPDETGGAP